MPSFFRRVVTKTSVSFSLGEAPMERQGLDQIVNASLLTLTFPREKVVQTFERRLQPSLSACGWLFFLVGFGFFFLFTRNRRS